MRPGDGFSDTTRGTLHVSAIFEHEGDDFEKVLRAAIEETRNAR
jgi:hypothetical protein